MKRTYIIASAVASAALALSPMLALAQNEAAPGAIRAKAKETKEVRAEVGASASLSLGSSTRATSTEERKAAWERIKAERAEVKIAAKGKLDAKRQTALKNAIQNRISKQEKAIQVVDTLVKRVNARLADFRARGAVTTASQSLVNQAVTKLASARAKLDAIKTTVASTTASTNVGKDVGAMRDAFDAVTTDTREAHSLVVDAIVALKGMSSAKASATVSATATTTATSTNQ